MAHALLFIVAFVVLLGGVCPAKAEITLRFFAWANWLPQLAVQTESGNRLVNAPVGKLSLPVQLDGTLPISLIVLSTRHQGAPSSIVRGEVITLVGPDSSLSDNSLLVVLFAESGRTSVQPFVANYPAPEPNAAAVRLVNIHDRPVAVLVDERQETVPSGGSAAIDLISPAAESTRIAIGVQTAVSDWRKIYDRSIDLEPGEPLLILFVTDPVSANGVALRFIRDRSLNAEPVTGEID